jgi:hypothetical protein
MPTEDDDLVVAMRCAKFVRVVHVEWSRSFSLVENRQHLIDGGAGFFLDAGGVETR